MDNRIEKYATNEFFRLKAEELISQINIAKPFLSIHKPSIGFWGESIIREFLRQSLPSGVKVAQGFIKSGEIISPQCDIIIYDCNRYASLATFGEIEIISSESVKAVLEIKSSIQRETFQKTLTNFEKLGDMGIENKYLLLFSSVNMKTIRSYFYEKESKEETIQADTTDVSLKYDHGSEYYLPSAIISLTPNYYLSFGHIYCTEYSRKEIIHSSPDRLYDCQERDMMGYVAYELCYHVKGMKKNISSLQILLVSLLDVCETNNAQSLPTTSRHDNFELMKIEYEFGLWDM